MVEKIERKAKRPPSIKELWNTMEIQQAEPISIMQTFIKEDVRLYYHFTQEIEQENPGVSLHKVNHKTSKQQFYIKTVPKNKESLKYLREFEALKKMDHPNIIKVVQQFEDENFCHVVLENPQGTELFALIEKENQISEKKACKIISQILKAIKYAHLNGICHRDIKPENVIIVDEEEQFIKLAGWEFCDLFSQRDGMSTPVGTLNYIAPEVFSGCYGPEIDC